MKHYPPHEFEPNPSPARARPRPLGFFGWLIIVLVTFASASVMLAINEGRVW
jgi:hypothetical protein